MRIDPHLVVADAGQAADWYSRALGAEEVARIPLPGGLVMSVELRLGESSVHVGSEFPGLGIVSPLGLGGTATALQIETDDAEGLWSRAIDAGAEVRHELADQFWGELQGQLTDPFGHRWNIAQRIREVPREQIVRAAARAFGGE
jgi:PhnB protein